MWNQEGLLEMLAHIKQNAPLVSEPGSPMHAACLELERQGLIRNLDTIGGRAHWVPVDPPSKATLDEKVLEKIARDHGW